MVSCTIFSCPSFLHQIEYRCISCKKLADAWPKLGRYSVFCNVWLVCFYRFYNIKYTLCWRHTVKKSRNLHKKLACLTWFLAQFFLVLVFCTKLNKCIPCERLGDTWPKFRRLIGQLFLVKDSCTRTAWSCINIWFKKLIHETYTRFFYKFLDYVLSALPVNSLKHIGTFVNSAKVPWQ